MRRPALQQPLNRLQESKTVSFPAAVGGWNAKDSLAEMAPTDCVQLDNWIVRSQALQTRLGSTDWATGMPAQAVESLLPYEAPVAGSKRMFAAVGSVIHNVTTQGAVGAAVQTGLTSARWQHVNYSNSAGNFLIIVNGTDSYRYWNGTAWTTVANFTLQPGATSYATTQLNNITNYRNRLFFCINNELAFAYLDAGAISGDVRLFRLGQIFRRGGFLAAVGTWTIDAGDGADDHFVAVRSLKCRGLVADWSLLRRPAGWPEVPVQVRRRPFAANRQGPLPH
jgi:hypothetical protein